MKGFGFTSLLMGGVLIILLISTLLMGYTMYTMAYAKKYEFDTQGKKTAEGVEAHTFWTENKMMMVIPTVSNVLSIVIVSALYIMG